MSYVLCPVDQDLSYVCWGFVCINLIFFFINISLDFFVFFALVQAQGYNDKKSIEQ